MNDIREKIIDATRSKNGDRLIDDKKIDAILAIVREAVSDDGLYKLQRAVERTIAHSLEDIGITSGSTLWYVKTEQAKDYFKEELERIGDRPPKKEKK